MLNEYLIVNSTEEYSTYTESVNGYYLLGVVLYTVDMVVDVHAWLILMFFFFFSLKFSDGWLFFLERDI